MGNSPSVNCRMWRKALVFMAVAVGKGGKDCLAALPSNVEAVEELRHGDVVWNEQGFPIESEGEMTIADFKCQADGFLVIYWLHSEYRFGSGCDAQVPIGLKAEDGPIGEDRAGRKGQSDFAAIFGGEFSAKPAALLPGHGNAVFFSCAQVYGRLRGDQLLDNYHVLLNFKNRHFKIRNTVGPSVRIGMARKSAGLRRRELHKCPGPHQFLATHRCGSYFAW